MSINTNETPNARGLFIVFEGIDGAGKTTQIDLLAEKLRAAGRSVFITAEPTVSTSGGILRDALAGLIKKNSAEMAALFVLDRIFHNTNEANGIKKMLDEGYDVICDRYYYSTMAYQGEDTDMDWVMKMNLDCPDILHPDLCIFLDLTPEQSLERISAGRAFTEIYENTEKLSAVRAAFYRVFDILADRENILKINAYNTPEAISEEIFKAIQGEVKGV